jgi:hypothetical protein
LRNATCTAGTPRGGVAEPVHVRRLEVGTGWFASPVIIDLDGDGVRELVVTTEDVSVFDAAGKRLVRATEAGDARVYAPAVVADLDGDGNTEIVVGQGGKVYAYEYVRGGLRKKSGWPVDTRTGKDPEVRGLAAADLDGNGSLEVIATTTQTTATRDGGAQVFVWTADGAVFQPGGAPVPAWPRYDRADGPGHDGDRNGMGHAGYGCYGLNVAIGNVDDDPLPEIVVTYDNHHLQVFDHRGVALDASPWFSNRQSDFEGQRLTWGQFIRFAEHAVEERHYHLHEGDWPGPATDEWLQWTASPPLVADLDGDGKNEVIGVPNLEKHEPYETQAYALVVLEGGHAGGERAARRKPGWEALARGWTPIRVGEYPPVGLPAPVAVDLQGDPRLEVVTTLNDGYVYAYASDGMQLWRFDFREGKSLFASEPAIADLDQDGSPEVIFTTYGAPDRGDAGRLVALAADGSKLFDVTLPEAGRNGNGNGAAAAPAVGDLDGDGQLEIVVQTFDHGVDVFTVPGSGTACVLWSTARGGPLRQGAHRSLGVSSGG